MNVELRKCIFGELGFSPKNAVFMSHKRLVLYLRLYLTQSSKANLPVIVIKPSQVVGYKMIVVTSRTFDNNYSFRIGLFTNELL